MRKPERELWLLYGMFIGVIIGAAAAYMWGPFLCR